jgi:hypothetical protein
LIARKIYLTKVIPQKTNSQVWQPTPVISALRREAEAGRSQPPWTTSEFKASPGYISRFCLKKEKRDSKMATRGRKQKACFLK